MDAAVVGTWLVARGQTFNASPGKTPCTNQHQRELVQVPVIVFDDKGGVASNLKKDDFRLFEDGVEQRILHCERERESVSFIILDDLSSSMTRKIPFVQEATLSVLDSAEQQDRYKDEFSVYGIASRARRLIPFTRDQKDLERRLPWLLTPTTAARHFLMEST